MLPFIYISLSVSLLCQPIGARNLGSFFGGVEDRDADGNRFPSKKIHFSQQEAFSGDGYDNTTSEYRSDEENLDSSDMFANESSEIPLNESTRNNNQLISSESSTTEVQNANIMNTTNEMETSLEIFNNKTQSSTSEESISSTNSSFIVVGTTKYGSKSGTFSSISPTESNNSSSLPDEEPEGVVIGKPSTSAIGAIIKSLPTKSLYQKGLELMSDAYTLSILLPIAAGVVFATTIIVTIAICKCLRRKCRRRRFHRKALPDSVKNLRPSDRARLLAESSDEEF